MSLVVVTVHFSVSTYGVVVFFFFKQKTAYELRISDWSSDVCSSDLSNGGLDLPRVIGHRGAAGHAPENTLASLRRAGQLGTRWVEFDVALTREGEPERKSVV